MVGGASRTDSEGLEIIEPYSLWPQPPPSTKPRLSSPQREYMQHMQHISETVGNRSLASRSRTAPGGRLFPVRARTARARLQRSMRSTHSVEAGPTTLISPDARGSQFLGMVFGTVPQRPSTSSSLFRPAEHFSGSPRVIHNNHCAISSASGGHKVRNEIGTALGCSNMRSSRSGERAVHTGFANGAVLISESSAQFLGLC